MRFQTYKQIGKYEIVKVVESDESIDIKRIDSSDDANKPINLTSYAQYDKEGNDTGNRRFIIGGGVGDMLELFVVFNQGDFNFIRKDATNRFVLQVRPPSDFEGKMYYGLMLDCRNDTPDKFAREMSRYVSPSVVVPKQMLSLALHL